MNYIFTPYSLLGKDPKKFKVKYRKHAFNPFVPRKKKFSEMAQILICYRYWQENHFLFLKNCCISFIS